MNTVRPFPFTTRNPWSTLNAMNDTSTETVAKTPFTEEQWDVLRYYLQDSVMVKTNLCSLAKNMGLKWPIRGKDETPERYINFTLAELKDMEEFYGKGNRLELLYTILLETKRLDEPFADMTRHLDQVAEDEAEAPPPLQQLEIPAELPLVLTNFSEETMVICRGEEYDTLGQLLAFLQRGLTTAVVNGEFKQFLNALNQLDTGKLRQYLPVREGSKGVYLAEALAHVARKLDPSQAATLIYAYRIDTTRPSWSEEAVLSKTLSQALISDLKETVQLAFDLMPDQAQQLRNAVQSGVGASVRFFVSIGDPDLEGLALAIAMAALDVKPRFKGLIGRFIN